MRIFSELTSDEPHTIDFMAKDNQDVDVSVCADCAGTFWITVGSVMLDGLRLETLANLAAEINATLDRRERIASRPPTE